MTTKSEARLLDMIKVDFAGDADGAYDGTAVMMDMKDYDRICVLVLGHATTPSATHHITSFNLVSNTTAAGAGTDHIIAEAVTTDGGTTDDLTQADMGTAAPTTRGDTCMLAMDVGADQLYAGDRYVAAVLTGTGTFTCTVVYIRYNGAANFKDMFQTTRTAFQYNGDLT